MHDVNSLLELVGGYQAYTAAGELTVSATTDAPETTVACLVWTITFNTAGSTVTIARGC